MGVGTLLTEDFLVEGIKETPVWKDLGAPEVAALRRQVADIFAGVADPASLNEAQTQHRIIEPILTALGWSGVLSVQTNIERRRRPNVSDYSFFPDAAAFAAADRTANHDDKLKHAVAVGDAKQWGIGLDQSGGGAGVGETPSAQIIRYLTRAETVSSRAVRWGILTNGRHWRLYFTGARSLLDGYFETDLAWVLGLPGTQGELGEVEGEDDDARRDRLFRTFLLFFRRTAFTPSARLGNKSFPEFAFDEGRLWETKVRTSLSDVVFDQVFPGLIRALASTDPNAAQPLTSVYLNRVREAALTMLYRLLFALYAEDRDLLPTRDRRFDDYALSGIRDDIADRLDRDDAFTNRSTRYWDHCVALFRIIDEGDQPLGVPPYNGGLFAPTRAPLIEAVRLGDAIFAPLLDALSRTDKDGRKVRINFRDLSVRELGAIYEGLLEYEPVADPEAQLGIAVRPNPFSRKTSGSYYTPDELVGLIIERTVGPLVEDRVKAFADAAARLASDTRPLTTRLGELVDLDPATAILELKVCDPAMGSGHFLVSLIDYLAAAVFTATGEAAAGVTWATYQSPILQRLSTIRDRIKAEAAENNWTVADEQLTDANLVKRMVLKRCVYGVDKNPMAVELAKVSLWLHTFTTGAPLSFLDHHLKCGDSLFGEKVGRVLDELSKRGAFLISDAVRKAEAEVGDMQIVEGFTDAEVAEVKASAEAYSHVEAGTAPLSRFLDFWQAIKWLDLTETDQKALGALLDGKFGDAVAVAAGIDKPRRPPGMPETLPMPLGDEPEQLTLDGSGVASVREWSAVSLLIERAHALAAEEHFLHWEVAFPGVWRAWQKAQPDGGFDAIVGNPPWDKIETDEVKWFRSHSPSLRGILKPSKSQINTAIARAKKENGALLASFTNARKRLSTSVTVARRGREYPLTSGGRADLFAMFAERALSLCSPRGTSGLLVPTGICADKRTAALFAQLTSEMRVSTLLDFENRLGPYLTSSPQQSKVTKRRASFFADVDSRFRFSVFVAAKQIGVHPTLSAGFMLASGEYRDGSRVLQVTSDIFTRMNPNTKTATFFRRQRDVDISERIYETLPVLHNQSVRPPTSAFPVTASQMFNVTTDKGGNIRLSTEMATEGAYPLSSTSMRLGQDLYLPVLTGRMIHQYNHRFAAVALSELAEENENVGVVSTATELGDADFFPAPQFWVKASDIPVTASLGWWLAFRDIARLTDERTTIAAIVPRTGAGHTMPVIVPSSPNSLAEFKTVASLFGANLNSFVYDYCARLKVQTTHLSWYIVEQLPVVPPSAYSRAIGTTTAEALIKDHVLRLTYTANDMAPFARDTGFDGAPFGWNEEERRHLRARLDALYFHLYGISDEADIRYILSTFPIVEKKDRAAWGGVYLTAELIIWYFRALAAGDANSTAPVATLLRNSERQGVQ